MKGNYMSFLLNEISWYDYQDKIKNQHILIIPIGATEQHGPHLPLGVDAMLATAFSLALAKQINGVVAPTLNYGYKSLPLSGGGPFFPGTIDLNGNTLIQLTKDIVNEFARDGWKHIVIFNCHYENEAFILEGADLASKEAGFDSQIFIVNWWDNLDSHIIDQVFDQVPFPGWALEHAAISETSLMMYFHPHLVDSTKIPNDHIEELLHFHSYPPLEGVIPATGCLHTSHSSSAEKGGLIVNNVVNNIVTHMIPRFKTAALTH